MIKLILLAVTSAFSLPLGAQAHYACFYGNCGFSNHSHLYYNKSGASQVDVSGGEVLPPSGMLQGITTKTGKNVEIDTAKDILPAEMR